MYGLDVNFLNDRPEYKPNAASRTKQRVAANPGDRRPLIFGAIAAVVFPAVAMLWPVYSTRSSRPRP